jgi:hypothetical protein
MIAQIIRFPERAPFAVHIEREDQAWLVICHSHGWLHGTYRAALAKAKALARGFGVVVMSESGYDR